MTFHKIWYCLIKSRIDSLSLSLTIALCMTIDVIMKWLISYRLGFTFTFHFNVIKQLVFCIGQYKFLWTLKASVDIDFKVHKCLKASVNIDFKVHKKSHWPIQKTEAEVNIDFKVHKNLHWPIQKTVIV